MQVSLSEVSKSLELQVVARVHGRDVNRGELSAAFDLVADATNWKLPIDATVAASERQAAIIAEAVVFFAGCRPTIDRISENVVRVRAIGYYAAVGA